MVRGITRAEFLRRQAINRARRYNRPSGRQQGPRRQYPCPCRGRQNQPTTVVQRQQRIEQRNNPTTVAQRTAPTTTRWFPEPTFVEDVNQAGPSVFGKQEPLKN